MEKLKGIALLLLITVVIVLAFQPSLAKAEKPELSLKTDKSIYHVGENVTIILANTGEETVEIGGYPAWQISTYPEDEPVFPEVYAFLIWNLAPGESDVFIWNSTFVETGTYIVRDLQGWGLSAMFEIVSETTPEFSTNIELAIFMILSMFIVILIKKTKSFRFWKNL